MLVQSTFFWYSRIPEILSTSIWFNWLQYSLLIVLIPSFFCWILALFSILLSTVLHHISGVSSFNFAPEGAGWLHHWTVFQFNLNLIYLGHLVPILCPYHLGHLITRGIMFPSFWHLCHLLHLLIIWSHLITCLIWVSWTGIGIV